MAAEFQDYYSILGIEKTASQNEIQRAYRKLARISDYNPRRDKKQRDRYRPDPGSS